MIHEPTRCECEEPGDFCCGVPGVLAAMQDGRLAPQAVVERCDQCCRFESDAAARARLVELGLADAPEQDLKSFTVHCFAVVRIRFPGVSRWAPLSMRMCTSSWASAMPRSRVPSVNQAV